MDIYDPLTARTRPATTTAAAETQAPRTTAASTARASTPQQQQTQEQPLMPTDQNLPTPVVTPPCPTCAPAPHWPWILALIVGGGLGWYLGSRKKQRV